MSATTTVPVVPAGAAGLDLPSRRARHGVAVVAAAVLAVVVHGAAPGVLDAVRRADRPGSPGPPERAPPPDRPTSTSRASSRRPPAPRWPWATAPSRSSTPGTGRRSRPTGSPSGRRAPPRRSASP